jgi:hypothetical protein
MCIAAKVSETVRLAKKALNDGKCIVIGLQSTGEARMTEQVEDAGGELNDFVSTAKYVDQKVPNRKISVSLFFVEVCYTH